MERVTELSMDRRSRKRVWLGWDVLPQDPKYLDLIAPIVFSLHVKGTSDEEETSIGVLLNLYHQQKRDGRINGERWSAAGPLTGNSKSVQASSLGLNQPCNILSWIGIDEMVAKGGVSAVDPSSKVHGYVLGPGCYRIEVEEAVNPRVEFSRFQPEFLVMEDVVGNTIARPIKYIMPHT